MEPDDPWIADEPDAEPSFEEDRRSRGVRFGEGQSPHHGGRPAGSPNQKTMIKRVASKRHRVKIDGRVRRKNTLDLVLRAVRAGASRGDIAAFELQEALKRRFGAPTTEVAQGVLILGEHLTSEEWDAIYGSDTTDEWCEKHFPHLLRSRRKFQDHQDRVNGLLEQAAQGGRSP